MADVTELVFIDMAVSINMSKMMAACVDEKDGSPVMVLSGDLGASWEYCTPIPASEVGCDVPVSVHAVASGKWYVAFRNGFIAVSSNDGESWTTSGALRDKIK